MRTGSHLIAARLTKDLVQRLDIVAAQHKVTKSDLIRAAIQDVISGKVQFPTLTDRSNVVKTTFNVWPSEARAFYALAEARNITKNEALRLAIQMHLDLRARHVP